MTRRLPSRTRTQQQQVSRLPTPSKKRTIIQKSKRFPKSPVQPNDPLAQRIQTLEQHVNSLQTLVSTLQSRLNKIESAVQVNNAGHVTIGQSGTVTIQGGIVKIKAASVDVQAATSKFSGQVQTDTVVTNSVISKSYTPGAGNIW